jgi:hypothetical protein
LEKLHLVKLLASYQEEKQLLLKVSKGGNLTFVNLDKISSLKLIIAILFMNNHRIAEFRFSGAPEQDDNEILGPLMGYYTIRTLELSYIKWCPRRTLHATANASGQYEAFAHIATLDGIPHQVHCADQWKVLNVGNYDFKQPVQTLLPAEPYCLIGLHELNLKSVQISNNAVEHIVCIAPKLRVLNISCPPQSKKSKFDPWPRYTAAGVQMALESLPELRQLGIDLPVQREWVAAYPQVRIRTLAPTEG